MQPHNYFLVLFTRDALNNPVAVGQKKIEKQQYEQLKDSMFKEFYTGEIIWVIMERRIFELAEQRRIFEKEEAIAVNCFVVIDAIKK